MRQEREKEDLSRILGDQIEDKKRRELAEKKRKLMEDNYYELKLLKDREELQR